MFHRLLILIITVLLVVVIQQHCLAARSSPKMKVTISNVTFTYDDHYAKVNVELEKSVINVTLDILVQLNRLTANASLFVKSLERPNSDYQHFFTKTAEMCDVLNHAYTDPLIAVVYKQLEQDKNHVLFKKCPIQPVAIYIKKPVTLLELLTTVLII